MCITVDSRCSIDIPSGEDVIRIRNIDQVLGQPTFYWWGTFNLHDFEKKKYVLPVIIIKDILFSQRQ